MRILRPCVLLVVLTALVAACAGAAEAPSPSPSPSPVTDGIGTADTDLGTILVDADGMTLYGFTKDSDGASTCYDQCAQRWPPVPGGVEPRPELDVDLFTTTRRDDGTTQLVIGTTPLYTYADDEAPGDVNGQGSRGVWFVVAPDGAMIDAPRGTASDEADTGLRQPVLTDGDGFTLYYFRKDEPGVSNCNEPCSTTWPPVPADEQVDTSALDVSRLGAVTRDDGSEQLAYDGMPLYLFVDDVAPGDVKGQGVGNVWFAVAADGSEIAPQGGVRIGSTDAGDVLIDPTGFTLYVFSGDESGASHCNDRCAETWRPVPADTVIDSSVREEQFDVATREDGSEQLALGGAPLYRFVDDVNPGDANGEGIGGVWSAVPADEVEPTGRAGAISVAHTDLGPTLVDGDGMTLYAFANDAFLNTSEGGSSCSDRCADAWPPVPGDVAVDDSVTGQTRTVIRADGSAQLAIGEWPLYTSSRDEEPGDISSHGSSGAWFAVAPDGTPYD